LRYKVICAKANIQKEYSQSQQYTPTEKELLRETLTTACTIFSQPSKFTKVITNRKNKLKTNKKSEAKLYVVSY
jgi:hypothetical protein